MTPNVSQSNQVSDVLLAEIDQMVADGKKIDAGEQRLLNASMKAAGFSAEQRGGILAAAKDFNRDGGGVGPLEKAQLSSLVESVAASNALRAGPPQDGAALNAKVQQASRNLETVTTQAGQDGKITPAESKAIKAANREFLDAVKAAGGGGSTGGANGADAMQKMMLDGLTETMKKRYGGKGGGDEGKAASGGGGGAGGASGAGSASSGGGVSIGEIAKVLGEALNEQFKKLVDAANALGDNPSAQQTAQLQALSAQVNANAGALTNAQRSAEEAIKAVARA